MVVASLSAGPALAVQHRLEAPLLKVYVRQEPGMIDKRIGVALHAVQQLLVLGR